ncbi:MAG: hypothetical protein IPN95_12130 [Bacteroidetes bacterium]|nr:hypothetical protein [Bacteroidota bacterium]
MRFAIVNGIRREAEPKLKGICPSPICRSEMVAKCGRMKIWHWAHKGNPPCDPWSESETEWHRMWKDHFPRDWQEQIHKDPETGEIHIADVKTEYDLVLEFQNSPIDALERKSREIFYKKMIWVVNGSRGFSDSSIFELGLTLPPICEAPLTYMVRWFGRGKLLHNWSEATCPVYIDFGNGILWKLLTFDSSKKVATVEAVQKLTFINHFLTGDKRNVDVDDRVDHEF